MRLLCDHCTNEATCFGAYEAETDIGFACSDCCGHGNEDGWCRKGELDLIAKLYARGRRDGLKAAHDLAMEAWAYHNDPNTEQRPAFGDGARGVALRIATRITEAK